jgi:tryptophanyl-tRNA synthetase
MDFSSGGGGSAGAALGIVIVSSDALALGGGVEVEVDDGGSFFSHAASDVTASASAAAGTTVRRRKMNSSGPEGSIEVRTAPSVQRRAGRDNANAASARAAVAPATAETRVERAFMNGNAPTAATQAPSSARSPTTGAAAGTRPRVFSGIQPSGELHVGNYLGAVRTWGQQIAAQKEELIFCIVDAHAITVDYDPKELRDRIDGLAIDLVACGLDPEACTLFVQSDVREHAELAWYLASVTPMGDLGRMTQFKEKSEGKEHVSTALFTYPVLMSADILLYKATIVPVGDDQVQHLELARETTRRFNHRFGRVFPEPQPRLSTTPRVMGLDGESKMSKSKNNTIALFDPPDVFWNKLRGAFTDPQRLRKSDPGRPEICNVYTMHKAISPAADVDLVHESCTGATWGCVDCKRLLHERFEKELVPLRTKRAALDAVRVREALADGAARARRIAVETMKEVRGAMGLGSGACP